MEKSQIIARARNIASIFLLFSLVACSTTGPQELAGHDDDSGLERLRTSLGSFGEIDHENNRTRGASSIENGAGLFARTAVVDPLIRPFSTIKSLFGVTLKSTGGFVDRTMIERVGMPSLEKLPLPEVGEEPFMDTEAWERELDELTGSERSSGNIRFLVDGEEYFNRLTEVVEQARESIDIRTYIFDNDDVSLKMARLLRDKSEALEIRILVDGLADIFASRLDSETMPDDVVLPSSISGYLTYESQIAFRKQTNPWFTGDHAKVTIVDGETAFVGGMNIGREYRYDWHDLMMEVDGPVVQKLQHDFDRTWAKSGWMGDLGWLLAEVRGRDEVEAGDGIPLRVLKTTVHNSQLYRAQIAAIRNARNRIYIQNAYFSDDKIMYELAKARRRGVDVRVIIGADNDSGVLSLSNQKAINTMLHHGIRVYSYPGMSHVKAAVYDGWACLGSANFDKLSLQINHEINLAFSDSAAVEELLARVFYPDFERSVELTETLQLAARHHLAEFIADELF